MTLQSPSPTLIFPGFGNSGPAHWQTRWEARLSNCQRIALQDWDSPERSVWVSTLEHTVQTLGPTTLIVAHSLACLAVAHWAAGPHSPIKAALLVAPPDPSRADFPPVIRGFSPLPLQAFDFPSRVVASTNDPFGPLDFARRFAEGTGSPLTVVGAAGHINADSQLGDWPEGLALLAALE